MDLLRGGLVGLCVPVLFALPVFPAPVSSNARAVIPQTTQQIISVDYRALRDSSSAHALRGRIFPERLREFEKALTTAGVDSDKDVEQLTFVSYRSSNAGLRTIAIAQGLFSERGFLRHMRSRKIRAEKYGLSSLYPLSSGMQLVFLDSSTILVWRK